MRKIGLSMLTAWLLLSFTVSVHAVTGFSEVNNELFDKAHLKNVNQPGVLHYKYKKQSFIDGEREDTIDMTVTNIRNTGRRDTHFEFFTGAHNRPYLDRNNQQGNGVFVLYLEFDIHELDRLTGGEWAYFQRKIRWALAKGAVKKDVEFAYQGEQIKGIQYIIQPFANDPKKNVITYMHTNIIFLRCLNKFPVSSIKLEPSFLMAKNGKKVMKS